jgi:hypothetical protein
MHNHAAGTGDLLLLGPAQAVVATGRDRPIAAGRDGQQPANNGHTANSDLALWSITI